MSKWIWRPMCGGFAEAMAQALVFDSKEQMIEFAEARYGIKPLYVEDYSNTTDWRNGWSNTKLICDDHGHAAGGFCTDEWTEKESNNG